MNFHRILYEARLQEHIPTSSKFLPSFIQEEYHVLFNPNLNRYRNNHPIAGLLFSSKSKPFAVIISKQGLYFAWKEKKGFKTQKIYKGAYSEVTLLKLLEL